MRFQPDAGSAIVREEPPPVSVTWSWPPVCRGSVAGRAKPFDFASIFSIVPVCT
jgi:hypothetical protein